MSVPCDLRPPVLPSSIDKGVIESLRVQAYDYCVGNGLVSHKRTEAGDVIMHVPCTLLPSPVPKKLFELAWDLAKDFNTLVHLTAQHPEFLRTTLRDVPDEFTRNLLKIYDTVMSEGIRQKAMLGLHRSDYMLHSPSPGTHSLQQVEINTISSAFPTLTTKTSHFHRYLLERNDLSGTYHSDNLPPNKAQQQIPAGLAHAWRHYNAPGAVVLMVVQEGERNRWDQRGIEYELFERHHVPLIRRTMREVIQTGALDAKGALILEGKYEVAVVYFRAGYTPNDYSEEGREWDARLLIERSLAIKCPSISYHLAGAKKVQQVLAHKGVLESLIHEKGSIDRLRSCFTGLYSLADGDSKEIIEDAKANPLKYVMKPQREGGGNNIYGPDVPKALSQPDRAAYILMDRISPQPHPVLIMRDGQIIAADAVSELGVYGVFLADGAQVLVNEAGGLLLRTKISHVEDGGVAAGVAVLDSPYLI
eukprot:TRINITY_DN6281_c0_g1_i1.p1 TRINITY_DN6281_c0_g1~~TRINITY_DN6281_c0_g1_i1.p1  ORF type:complete len:476 (+),score=121.43 TRINITY_DN6281_c0_g1_i1:55-1482(+)